jgi:chromate transporter
MLHHVLQASHPSLTELAKTSLKIGLLGFGGPAGQIALMHRIFVDEKKWIDEDRYLYALSYCTLLPGPEAQQLATYAGWLLHGVRGGLIAGTLFILPGALAMLGLSWLYVVANQLPFVDGALFGLRAVVLALLVQSVIKMGRKSLAAAWAKIMAIISFVALTFAHVPFPALILIAGAIGAGIALRDAGALKPALSSQRPHTDGAKSFIAALVWVGLWLLPLGVLALLPALPDVLGQIATLFSGLSLVTFGGAYAATAWINQQAVEAYGWLSAQQMMDGLALVQAIPGPLVLVNQYVGFVAGWNQGGLALAITGGLLASWCTFAPSFVWIFAGAPFAERLRDNRIVGAALKGVNTAVVGVIASLAFSFGMALLFGNGVRGLPDLAKIDVGAAGITMVAMLVLIRTKLALPYVLALGLVAGMVVQAR